MFSCICYNKISVILAEIPVADGSIKPLPTIKNLKSDTRQVLKLAGEATVEVQVEGVKKSLELYIAKEDCPAVFGHDWI